MLVQIVRVAQPGENVDPVFLFRSRGEGYAVRGRLLAQRERLHATECVSLVLPIQVTLVLPAEEAVELGAVRADRELGSPLLLVRPAVAAMPSSHFVAHPA